MSLSPRVYQMQGNYFIEAGWRFIVLHYKEQINILSGFTQSNTKVLYRKSITALDNISHTCSCKRMYGWCHLLTADGVVFPLLPADRTVFQTMVTVGHPSASKEGTEAIMPQEQEPQKKRFRSHSQLYGAIGDSIGNLGDNCPTCRGIGRIPRGRWPTSARLTT